MAWAELLPKYLLYKSYFKVELVQVVIGTYNYSGLSACWLSVVRTYSSISPG